MYKWWRSKPKNVSIAQEKGNQTRSQAVARIADRTASQHMWDYVTSSVTWPFDGP